MRGIDSGDSVMGQCAHFGHFNNVLLRCVALREAPVRGRRYLVIGLAGNGLKTLDLKGKVEMKKWMNLLVIGLVCFLGLPSPVSAQLKTVKIALTSKEILDNLPYFVGMRMGFFKEVGIDLEPSYFRGGGEVLRAVTSRATDIGGSVAPSAVFIAVSKGERVKILSANVAPLVGVVWLVKSDSPIKSIKDLKGKKVGYTSPGAVSETTIQYILKAENLSKDVELVRAGTPGDNWMMVKNGVIDAGYHVAPGLYDLIAKKEARILIRGTDYVKNYMQTCVAVMEDVVEKNPDMVRSLLKARAKAVKFIWDNPEKTVSIWADELKLPIEATRLAHKDLPRTTYPVGAPRMEDLQGSMQEAIGTGAMKEPLDLKKVLDLRFLP